MALFFLQEHALIFDWSAIFGARSGLSREHRLCNQIGQARFDCINDALHF
jgi:hypothetical protein